ncbi:MAG: hypothetical protein FJ049_00145 [Cyanobacteria bacterium M_surface_7_m2_037]|nr:hypothetical protein [Cyanobacteria bacterium M_surface_7_m2_037]
MTSDRRQSKPRGFGLFSRIVYVHQVVLLAIFVDGLRVYPALGITELVLPHSLGIVLSIAVLIAMFGVATRKSLNALHWLRLILWVGVVKILVIQLWLLAQGQIEVASYIRTMFINELVAIPLAIYWTRPVHVSYLASLQRS